MPAKYDPDTSPGVKLLKIFRKLLLDGRKHFQTDLANEFLCSAQTVIRIMADIESVIGGSLEYGTENRRRWYRIATRTPKNLGLDFEELRYISVCRDLASQTLPDRILSRVDDTIFNLSMQMVGLQTESLQKQAAITFASKGRIDYEPYFSFIEILLEAITDRRVCKVGYKALGKKNTREHLFLPHRLIEMNHALYALGAIMDDESMEAGQFTNLAVHRIQAVEKTPLKAEIDFPEISGNTFGLPWHEPRTFRIHFKAGKAAEYVAERIWSDTQKIIKQDDGSVILEITTSSEPELMAWIRSFGESICMYSEIHIDSVDI